MNKKEMESKKTNVDIKLLIIFIIITVIKFIVASQSSIYISISEYDDWLVINRAQSIIDGQWLGNYTHLTLVKGIGFEIFLCVFNFLKISFVSAQAIMYIVACIYFIYAIRNIVKSKKVLLCIYFFMLFNPISIGFDTFQRVYRYNIIQFQILFIFSSYYLLYEKISQKKKKILPHILVAMIFLTWFRLTIESYFWILPFIFVVTGILIFNIIKEEKNVILKILNILIIFLPILAMVGTVTGIKCLNKKVYGVYVYNDILETNFSEAIKAIYSVDVNDNIELVSVSQKKLEKLYKISPTLQKIQFNLDKNLLKWKDYDQIKNNEIEDGWFYWVFKVSVFEAGYDTPQKADNFYKNVAKEINDAKNDGEIKTKSVMPNPLMSPYRDGYISKLLLTMLKSVKYIVSFEDITVDIIKHEIDFNDLVVLQKCINNKNLITTAILFFIVVLYKFVGPCLFVISCMGYFITNKKYLFKHEKEYKNIWLISTACLLTTILIIAGVSYTHISAFNSINSLYLVGAYPLIGIFICLNGFVFIKKFFDLGEIDEKN